MGRILQIIADGRPGGGTTAVLTLSRGLAARGADIIIATQQGSYLQDESVRAGVAAYGLDFMKRSNTVRLAVRIKRLWRDTQPSLVHVHGGRAALPVALISHACPVAYTVHGFHFIHKPPGLYRLACLAEALCIARADATVFVSDAGREAAAKRNFLALSRDYRIIKNAVDVDIVNAAKRYDIGFMGRLHNQKNPLFLIDILKSVRPARPSLCVIGGGDLRRELETRIVQEDLQDQVTLIGECDRNTALMRLSECRVMVLPSRWEGHPIALIEAMFLGIPVVASDIAGSNEIALHGRTGFLVSHFDPAVYAQYLQKLLNDMPLREEMGNTARCEAIKNYSVQRMVAAYYRLYQQLDAAIREPQLA